MFVQTYLSENLGPLWCAKNDKPQPYVIMPVMEHAQNQNIM